ncbi:MAG TPA: FtsQ-type POTRA domain-containing protein [Candidatus Dormibacteraeota bacterium]|nr:FtsQ-type POTRA domain-containing protein [Candidatus Dormibacteraeota bacterium]
MSPRRFGHPRGRGLRAFPSPALTAAGRAPRRAAPGRAGAPWTRRGRAVGGRRRRGGSLLLLLAEVGLLVALLAGPIGHVARVQVSGNQRLTDAQVVALAGLERPGSVFMVDPRAVGRRLLASPWVRTASVSTDLPDRVTIRVEEWQPVAVYRAGAGPPYDLSDQAVVLGPARGRDSGLLEIDGPPRPAPRPGRSAMDRALLVALVDVQRQLPGLIGQQVRSFTLDACGNLTMVVARGWQVQFGRVLTPEELAALSQKVAALRQLQAAGVNYDDPRLRYVNVMNPSAAAVAEWPPASAHDRSSRSSAPAPRATAAPILVTTSTCH